MVKKFTFNVFQENTYVIYDETKECIIIDAGCSTTDEKNELMAFIAAHQLIPVRLINTHCHIDHIPGNGTMAATYNIGLEYHEREEPVKQSAPDFAKMFGISVDQQPSAKRYIQEGEIIAFGNTQLKVLFTPGHSPGSISLYNKKENYVIVGDVLFYESIGRYDLPGADGNTLMQSIQNQLLTLPDDTIVYNGHGRNTTIGHERIYNPFINRKFV